MKRLSPCLFAVLLCVGPYVSAAPAAALDHLTTEPSLSAPPEGAVQRVIKAWTPFLVRHCEPLAEAAKWAWSHSVKEEHVEFVEFVATAIGYVTCRYLEPRVEVARPKLEPVLHDDGKVLDELTHHDSADAIKSQKLEFLTTGALLSDGGLQVDRLHGFGANSFTANGLQNEGLHPLPADTLPAEKAAALRRFPQTLQTRTLTKTAIDPRLGAMVPVQP